MSEVKVWVVSGWIWGGGGDDYVEIIGVYSDEETARIAMMASEVADRYEPFVLDAMPAGGTLA